MDSFRKNERNEDLALSRTGLLKFFFLGNCIVTFYFYMCVLHADFILTFDTFTWLSVINLEIVVYFLSRALVNANDRFLECIFWIFQLIFLAMTPLAINWDPIPNFLNIETKQSPSDLVLLVILSSNLIVGVITSGSPKKNNRRIHEFNFETLFQRAEMLRKLYFLLLPFLIGFIGYNYIFRKVRYSVSVDFGPIFYMAEALLYVLPTVIFLSYSILSSYHNSKDSFKWRISFGIILVVLSNPIANARQIVLLLLIPLVYPKIRKSLLTSRIFSVAVTLTALFATNPFDRYTGKFLGLNFTPLSRLGDYDAYSQLFFAIRFGQMGLFEPLNQLAGSIFFFIPRQYWPNKPLDSGVIIGNARNLRSTNLSCPWIAEAYINGGVVFVVLVCVLVALLFRRMQKAVFFHSYIIEGMLCGVALILLRGSLLQASGKTILGLVACFYLTRRASNNRKVIS